jgi:hypothetical protein
LSAEAVDAFLDAGLALLATAHEVSFDRVADSRFLITGGVAQRAVGAEADVAESLEQSPAEHDVGRPLMRLEPPLPREFRFGFRPFGRRGRR